MNESRSVAASNEKQQQIEQAIQHIYDLGGAESSRVVGMDGGVFLCFDPGANSRIAKTLCSEIGGILSSGTSGIGGDSAA